MRTVEDYESGLGARQVSPLHGDVSAGDPMGFPHCSAVVSHCWIAAKILLAEARILLKLSQRAIDRKMSLSTGFSLDNVKQRLRA